MLLQTEFEFTLPCGYLDGEGTLHREGVMRRATAADEILPLRDPRVAKNQAYLLIILLSRVIVRLGGLPQIDTRVVENLFTTDMEFLQSMYNRINLPDHADETVCPNCHHRFRPEPVLAGE